MFVSVPITPKPLEDYRPIIGDERVEELRRLAEPLRGTRVLHLNATAFGGGVAEMLATLTALMRDLGLAADWQVMRGEEEFFRVTKAMHNSLQGMFIAWTAEMREIWLRYNQLNAALFDQDYDFVVLHDPQPAGMLHFLANGGRGRPGGRWIWRCHIDLTAAQIEVWDFLRPAFIELYDAAIFTLADFVKDDLKHPGIFIMPPGIDPLSPKNADLAPGMVAAILHRYGIDTARPFLCQVSRFDPWKDPLGVIDAYRLVKQQMPEIQLVMVASMAHDDPEGWAWYERTVRRAGEDYDIHILSNFNGVGNLEVNAFQRAAQVVVQKSLREGFGLTVAEALWKGRPVVAGNAGGIPLQIINGQTGYLINRVPKCAERVLYLLRHPKAAKRMGQAGREHIRHNFLITRYLRDYLRVFRYLGGEKIEAPVLAPAAAQRIGAQEAASL